MQFMFAALKLELGDTLYYLLIFAALLLLVKHFAWGPVTKDDGRTSSKGNKRP